MGRRVRNVYHNKIGILVNSRDNTELLAREIARFYQENHQCTIVNFFAKRETTIPCPPEQLQKMSQVCDFLIMTVGDSESSTVCILHDGINFEQYGKPALVVCTKPFKSMAEDTARELALPLYPFVVVDHPIGVCTPAEITERALAAYRQGMASLTGMFLLIG